MIRILHFLIITSLFTGCARNAADHNLLSVRQGEVSETIKYAKGFTIQKNSETVLITVNNPWQFASGVQYKYLLSDTFQRSSVINEFTCQIKTPVKNVVCLSTTHIGFVDYIDEIASVKGISGMQYVVNEELVAKFEKGLIADVGYDENLNYELLLKLNPDIVFAYGVSMAITNTVNKLNELGIPVILIGEYLEEEPLAKMEWVKVFAAFYNKQANASVKFDSVAERYSHLTRLAENAEYKPGVLLGLPWQGTWYISGSKSYVARLINDAGGKYIFGHLNYNESKPVSLEVVFENAFTADFWLNTGDAGSKKDISSIDERFNILPSYTNDHVFNNNNILNKSGGNAFFESGVIEPDIILSDLIYILHPQLLPLHSLKYYRKLP